MCQMYLKGLNSPKVSAVQLHWKVAVARAEGGEESRWKASYKRRRGYPQRPAR